MVASLHRLAYNGDVVAFEMGRRQRNVAGCAGVFRCFSASGEFKSSLFRFALMFRNRLLNDAERLIRCFLARNDARRFRILRDFSASRASIKAKTDRPMDKLIHIVQLTRKAGRLVRAPQPIEIQSGARLPKGVPGR